MVQRMPGRDPVIILTRPVDQNDRFEADLRAAGVENPIIKSPVTRIDPIVAPVSYSDDQPVIFTSANAVRYAPGGSGIAWCVGDKTAGVAAAKGWQARSVSGDAEQLFQRICADLDAVKGQVSLCHLCGKETRGDLAARLTQAGFLTKQVQVYEQSEEPLTQAAFDAACGPIPAIFPVFSPNSSMRLVGQLPQDRRADFVAISPAVAKALPAAMVNRLRIAEKPDAQSVIFALRQMV